MKMETIASICKEVENLMCEKYCKYPDISTSIEELIDEHCESCPLNRLGVEV